jgi:hypothetical protein
VHPFHLEPWREGLGRPLELALERLDTDETPSRDLADIDVDGPVVAAEIDGAQLVLRAHGAELRVVLELVEVLERTGEAELLLKAARDRLGHVLAAARMRATRVRPIARPQHLARRPLLQQQLIGGIEDEDRERTVQQPSARMGIGFSLEADLAVEVVDQDQLLACVRDDLFTRHSNPLRGAPATPGSRPRESR